MNSFLRFYDSPGRRDVPRASVRLFDAKANRAEVFLLICEEFGIGICVTYSPVQRRGLVGPRAVGAFRGRERKEAKEAREQRERSPGRRKEGNEEEKKEEGEEDEGFVEKAFRVGVARWASRLPRRECG